MNPAFLRVEGLELAYPGAQNPAIKNIHFCLEAGEIGVLMGPSGSGKTTVLRTIAGLERAQQGRISLNGICLEDTEQHVPTEQRRIGMVFQDFALFPHLTVAQNISFGLHRQPPAQRRARVAEMLALIDLSEAAKKYPHQISGGQQQRVALARSLAPAPRLLLLDEPFSSLDSELRLRLAQEVRKILKTSQTTALMVTHDQMEAFAIGDKVGVMAQGCLHQWDTPYILYHAPKTRFVANFIGNGVFIRGQVKRIKDQWWIATALGEFYVNTLDPSVCGAGKMVDVLVRPDDVQHNDYAAKKLRIQQKIFRGASFLYTLETTEGETIFALVPSHHDHAIGENMGIQLEMRHVIVFPSEQ